MVESNLFKRTVAALILGPLVIASIFLQFPYYPLLVLAAGAALSWEWSNMTAQDKKSDYAVIYTISMAVAVMLQSWFGIFLTIFVCSVLVFVKARQEKHRWLLLLGVPYISIGIGSLMWLMLYFSALTVLWVLLLVWAVDVGGYMFGCSIKGPKLAPRISPNKTWSGLFGGMFMAAFVSVVFIYYTGFEDYAYYAVFAAVLAVVEQIGDLIESAIKRKVGVKDSSNIIPGHGGVFDRIDGLIFTAPVLLAVIFIFHFYF